MKILLPTDGSRYALAAARALSGWFAWPGGEVDLLAVKPNEPPSGPRPLGRDLGRAREWRAAANRWLSSTERPLSGSGLRVNRMTRLGEPAAVVLEVAAEGGYDLVVAGAKGRGRKPHLRLGSVARALAERLPTSVLLVREREPRGRGRRLSKRGSLLRTVTVRAPGAASKRLTLLESRLTESREGRTLEGAPDPSEVIEVAEGADLLLVAADLPGAAEVVEQAPCSVLLVVEPAGAEAAAHAMEPAEAVEPGKSGDALVPAKPRGVPFAIQYHEVGPSPEVERFVLRGIQRLERAAPDLIRVDVTVSRRSARRHKGDLYDVTLRLSVAGPDVVVSRTPPPRVQNENVVRAINDAFRTARRRLLERRAVARGDVKAKEAPALGTVTEVFPDYGFIEGSDGRIVYFHRNAVVGGAWDDVAAGARVRFTDEPGENGPKAIAVRLVGGRGVARGS
ncbi:MAG TPA: universal stress protein [Longimicrobiales bacterium]|nr:universal stress protein [Longimicrobiales bacterium]